MKSKINKTLIVIAIITLGMLLRTPITSVGAISSVLKELLNINNTMVGFITTIPLIAFALISPLVSQYGHKKGLEKTIFLATLLITIGLLGRFYLNTYVFFLTTFIIGVGITVGNVLLPGLTKKYFPTKLGVMTGFYAVIMTISASIAAGISYPIATSNIISSEFSAALASNIWIVIALINVVIYYIIAKNIGYKKETQEEKLSDNKKEKISGSSKIWTLTLSMGLQSALFYCSVSWFADIMASKGFSKEMAGLLLSISQFAQFPSTFLVPVVADRLKNKLIIPTLIALGYIVSIVGMIFTYSNFAVMTIWIILFALSGGGSFSYVMYLFSAKTKNSKEAAKVSGIAQSGGYLIAAIFPPLLGYIRDQYDWNTALYVLLGVTILLFVNLIHCSFPGNIFNENDLEN